MKRYKWQQGYKTRETMYFDQSVNAPPWQPPRSPAGPGGEMEAERIRPVRSPTIEADFLTPFLQSLGVGVFALLLAGYVVIVYGWLWHLSCLAGVLAAGGWFIGGIIWGRRTMTVKETVWTGPGQPGPAPLQLQPPDPAIVTVKGDRDKIEAIHRLDVGIDAGKLAKFAHGILAGGRSLAEASWTGSGNPFSRAEYNRLLAELEAGQFVEWVNADSPNQGRRLTAAGRELLAEWSKD